MPYPHPTTSRWTGFRRAVSRLGSFVIRHSSFVILVALASLGHAADSYTELLRSDLNTARPHVAAIEAEIRAASPDQLRAIEGKLVRIIQAPNTNAYAKSWACRTLRIVGSEQSVPTLAALLTDAQLAADAQFALRSIRGPRVDTALREALRQTQGLLKAGVIQTLGARGDRLAVALIAPLAGDADPAIAEASLYALGHIGGRDALKAIETTQVADRLKRYRQHAMLLCGESLLGEGNTAEASAAYRALYEQSDDSLVKSGALRGILVTDQAKAAPILAAALKSDDPVLRSSAAKFLSEVANDELFAKALGQFSSWYPDTQALVLGMTTNRAALSTARAAAQNENPTVRLAGIGALGRIGEWSDLPLLLNAAGGKGAAQSAARKSLASVRGPRVDEALIAAATSKDPTTSAEAVNALAGRHVTAAVPTLVRLAETTDKTIRSSAFKALATLAEASDLPELVRLVVDARSAAARNSAEATLASVAQRATDKSAATVPLLAALPGPNTEARCALLRGLAQIPTPGALKALRAAATDADSDVRDTGVRGLADWPDTAALPDLQRIARNSDNKAHRVLALRGVIRLAALPNQRPPEQTAQLLGDALSMASSPNEQKLALAALADLNHRAALDVATSQLSDPAIEVEAANTVVRLARKLQKTDAEAASAAVQKILDTCQSPAARQVAESAGMILSDMLNIAPQGVATSPDGLEKDGAAGGDQAAIDGDPATYWDEEDGKKLYRLVVTFKQPETIAAASITGHAHHSYAPKDFDVICDGKPAKSLRNAQYSDNFLVIPLSAIRCQTVELKITGYHGASPAIRELGLYRKVDRKKAEFSVLVYSRTLGFRHSSIADGIAAIRALGAEHGFAIDATEDSSVFTRQNLARYKAIVFLSVTGDVLNPEQEAALKDYVTGGGGFAAIHGALFGPAACEEEWAWYGEAMCVAFKNHSAVVPARVDIEDKKNPSTAGLPERWFRTDEWYNYDANPRGCARILATLDESTYQGGTMGADHPIAWCKLVGQGRIWYTAMGHTESSFAEPLFQKHLLGGIQLVAGVKPGEFTANEKRAKPHSPALTTQLRNTHEWLVRYGDTTLCDYATGQWKPYVRALHTLRGDNVLRDSPFDHKHHHALMYAIKVNGINFWEETTESGFQKPVKTEPPVVTTDAQGHPQTIFTQTLHWLAPPDASSADTRAAALLIEQRTLTLTVDEAAQEVALHWKSDWSVGGKTNQVTLTGANYHGLGMRFLEELDSLATHRNAGDAPDLGGTKQDVSRHAWGSVSFNSLENPATVALFGHPQNARGNAWFFTMKRPFAYLSATQNLDQEPLVYRAGNRFELNYLVTVYPGLKSPEVLGQRAQRWQSARP